MSENRDRLNKAPSPAFVSQVKGQISEMAVCLVDDNQTIADSATYFFAELANKGIKSSCH